MLLGQLSAQVRMRVITGLGLLGLCAVIGGLGYLLMTMATRQLLDAEIKIDAARWSSYLTANIQDLPEIAEGSSPSPSARALIDRTLAGGYLGKELSQGAYDGTGFVLDRGSEAAMDWWFK